MAIPSVLDRSDQSIFFAIPEQVQIDEDARTEYAGPQTFEVLMKELLEKGPLVALGKMGPSSYSDAAFKLKGKVCGLDVHGWKPGAVRDGQAPQSYALVLGAKKIGASELVFFMVSQDVTVDRNTYVRTHVPSTLDARVYVVSHNTFRAYLFDLYPPKKLLEASDEKSTDLPAEDREYVKMLSALSIDSILDMGDAEKACKALGQEIFDKHKKAAGGKTEAGKAAVVRICNALKGVRKQHVERAWDGIGDEAWRWSR